MFELDTIRRVDFEAAEQRLRVQSDNRRSKEVTSYTACLPCAVRREHATSGGLYGGVIGHRARQLLVRGQEVCFARTEPRGVSAGGKPLPNPEDALDVVNGAGELADPGRDGAHEPGRMPAWRVDNAPMVAVLEGVWAAYPHPELSAVVMVLGAGLIGVSAAG
ncbi:MAG: hypothetical protein M3313_10865 [Actinomycetota bacterium]|nr:hypothetical protein [Actinomycetota bacterium]